MYDKIDAFLIWWVDKLVSLPQWLIFLFLPVWAILVILPFVTLGGVVLGVLAVIWIFIISLVKIVINMF